MHVSPCSLKRSRRHKFCYKKSQWPSPATHIIFYLCDFTYNHINFIINDNGGQIFSFIKLCKTSVFQHILSACALCNVFCSTTFVLTKSIDHWKMDKAPGLKFIFHTFSLKHFICCVLMLHINCFSKSCYVKIVIKILYVHLLPVYISNRNAYLDLTVYICWYSLDINFVLK